MIDQSLIDRAAAEAVKLRAELHRHPELSWEEKWTTDRLEEELKSLGVPILKKGVGPGNTGLIAQIDGERPGPCVALRADIDALPVEENSAHSLRSEVPGKMHACGHDAHASILIGAARVMSACRDQISGSVRLLLQPAEESGYQSGARPMIEAGALEGVSAIFGLHVWSNLPKGVIGWRHGAMMASADIWEARVVGQGGHGSEPQTAVDPIVAAGDMIGALQTIVSRETDPREPVVVSVGRIASGNAVNVIPQECVMAGNVRTTTREARNSMEAKFRRILDGLSMAYRCKTELTWTPIYPVTVNHPEATDYLVKTLTAAGLGDALTETPLLLGSEDFSYYGEVVPASFCLLGMDTGAPHHSPDFRVDDDVLPLGIRMMAELGMGYGRQG